MKKRRKENKIKGLVKLLVQSLLLTGLLLGAISLLGLFVEWSCADSGRYFLVMLILGYGLYKIFKSEFDN